MTLSILIALGLFSLPDRNKLQMLKNRQSQNQRPIHRRLLQRSFRPLLRHTAPLLTKNPLNQMTGRQNLLHLLANIDSQCPMGCLRVCNDRCTFPQGEVGDLPHPIPWTASIPHRPTNPLTLSMPFPRDGEVHLALVLRQTTLWFCAGRETIAQTGCAWDPNYPRCGLTSQGKHL